MLFHSKLRSWLTIIGIVIGVGAVVGIVSLGDNMQKQVQSRLSTLDMTTIYITPGYSKAQSNMPAFYRAGRETTLNAQLTDHDIEALRSVDGITSVSGLISGRENMSYNGESASLSIVGVDPQVWQYMNTLEVESGRLLEPSDKYVAVIGSGVASGIYIKDVGVNQIIEINGKSVRVVGILKEQNEVQDQQINMPRDAAMNLIKDAKRNVFNSIEVKAQSADIVDTVSTAIVNKLMVSRHINKEDDRDFSLITLKSIAESVTNMITSMSLFLGAIAAVSLIVGAVGIATTMFTSVLEKTKDIGTMKAIGAKNKDILMIFLFNSAMVGLVGGILGVILGTFVSSGLQAMMGMTGSGVSPYLIVEGLLLAIMVGVISGVVPAYRASKLKPVDALRYD